MGLRFRKSFKIAPGVKVNVNKKSAGVTIGTKGAHYTVNTSGRQTASVGLPGSGLSYSTSLGGAKKGSGRKTAKKNAFSKMIGVVIAVAAVVCTVGAIKTSMDKNAAVNAVTAQTPDSASGASAGSAAAADIEQTMVWISSSGKKYHAKSDCSGMDDASKVSLQEALDMGREACKRCNP